MERSRAEFNMVIQSKYHALTPQNLVYLGLHEPFYQLYADLKVLITKSMRDFYAVNEYYPDLQQIRTFCNREAKKLCESFLLDHSDFFQSVGFPYHSNALFLSRLFNGIRVIKTKGDLDSELIITSSYNSFNGFLKCFETAMAERICKIDTASLQIRLYLSDYLYKLYMSIQAQVVIAKRNRQDVIPIPTETMPICEKLYIYQSLKLISCNQHGHEVSSSFCFCKLAEKEMLVRLPVHICMTCGRHFIGKESIEIYEKIYGILSTRKIRDTVNTDIDFDQFGQSQLYQTGYNVQENGLCDVERKDFLKELIDTKVMTPFEIIRDLEHDIRIFQNSVLHQNAVAKWKSDLAYVNSLIEQK